MVAGPWWLQTLLPHPHHPRSRGASRPPRSSANCWLQQRLGTLATNSAWDGWCSRLRCDWPGPPSGGPRRVSRVLLRRDLFGQRGPYCPTRARNWTQQLELGHFAGGQLPTPATFRHPCPLETQCSQRGVAFLFCSLITYFFPRGSSSHHTPPPPHIPWGPSHCPATPPRPRSPAPLHEPHRVCCRYLLSQILPLRAGPRQPCLHHSLRAGLVLTLLVVPPPHGNRPCCIASCAPPCSQSVRLKSPPKMHVSGPQFLRADASEDTLLHY